MTFPKIGNLFMVEKKSSFCESVIFTFTASFDRKVYFPTKQIDNVNRTAPKSNEEPRENDRNYV